MNSCFVLNGITPLKFIQDIESHHKGWILLQWIKILPCPQLLPSI